MDINELNEEEEQQQEDEEEHEEEEHEDEEEEQQQHDDEEEEQEDEEELLLQSAIALSLQVCPLPYTHTPVSIGPPTKAPSPGPYSDTY